MSRARVLSEISLPHFDPPGGISLQLPRISHPLELSFYLQRLPGLNPFFASCICFAQDKITYEDKGRRDPFIALVTADGRLLNLEPVSKEVKIILEGIIYDKGGQSYAIINGEVVSAGGFIQGYTVFKIEKDKVILIKDDKLVEYKLEKEEP